MVAGIIHERGMNAVARTLVTIAVVAALVAALAQSRQPTQPAQAVNHRR